MRSSVLGAVAVLAGVAITAAAYAGDDLCKQYVDQKEFDKAIDECSMMLTISAYPADEAYNNRGIAYAGKKQYEQAVADYTRAIGLNQKFDKAYNNRGNAYWHLGQFEKSFADYHSAIAVNPNDASAYYNVACRYSLRQNAQESCAWLQKAVDKGFDNWDYIKKDSDFDNIRGSSCFREIMTRAATPPQR